VKEEITEEIERQIPLFEFRDVYTRDKQGQDNYQKDWKAIHEVDSPKAVAFVTKRYTLIQLREACKKAVEQLEDITAKIDYYNGRASMEVFPANHQYGICVENSVDRTLALKVSYVVNTGGITWTIPHRLVEGFRRKHVGKALLAYEDFLAVIKRVETAWKTIIEKLSKEPIGKDGLEDILKAINAGKRIRKRIDELNITEDTSVWNAIARIVRAITDRRYKTDWHKKQKLRRLSTILLNLALFREFGKH